MTAIEPATATAEFPIKAPDPAAAALTAVSEFVALTEIAKLLTCVFLTKACTTEIAGMLAAEPASPRELSLASLRLVYVAAPAAAAITVSLSAASESFLSDRVPPTAVTEPASLMNARTVSCTWARA